MKRLQRDAEMFRCGKTVSGADDQPFNDDWTQAFLNSNVTIVNWK